MTITSEVMRFSHCDRRLTKLVPVMMDPRATPGSRKIQTDYT